MQISAEFARRGECGEGERACGREVDAKNRVKLVELGRFPTQTLAASEVAPNCPALSSAERTAFQRLNLVATLRALLETRKTGVVSAHVWSAVCVSRMDLVWCDGLVRPHFRVSVVRLSVETI